MAQDQQIKLSDKILAAVLGGLIAVRFVAYLFFAIRAGMGWH